MNELRWILLGFGIALLAGIYLWGRRFRPGVRGDGPAPVIEPPRIEPDYRELDIPPHLRSGEPSVQPPVEDPYAHVTEPLDEPEEPAISAHDRSAAERVPSELKRDSSAGVADEDPEPVAESGSGRNDEQTGGKFTTFRSVRKEPRLGPLAVELDAGATSMRTKRPEPTLGSTETAISESRADAVSEVSASDPDDTATPESDQTTTTGSQPRRRIFAVRLVAPAGSRYHGRHLLEAFRAEQLQHGRYGIFHRLDGAGDSVFSLASMVEPGSFDLDAMPHTEFPGLTFFAVLPGSHPGAEPVAAMIAAADRLQRLLGGALQDERGMPLDEPRLAAMRSDASDFAVQRSTAARSSLQH